MAGTLERSIHKSLPHGHSQGSMRTTTGNTNRRRCTVGYSVEDLDQSNDKMKSGFGCPLPIRVRHSQGTDATQSRESVSTAQV